MITSPWDVATATWIKASGSNDWNEAGGDFSATVIGSCDFPDDASGTWLNFNVTAAIKDLIDDPAKNLGFITDMGEDGTLLE